MAKLVEALAETCGQFREGSPAVMSLIASILFLLIATLGAGIVKVASAH